MPDAECGIIRLMDGWESLGGELASTPAVTSWAADEMQVFAIWRDGQLWDIYWDGAAWHEWHPHGGQLTGNPTACSWGPDRIDVFARGQDGRLWHRWYEPAGWQDWEQLPVAMASDPSACAWGPNRIRRLRARRRRRPAARPLGREPVVDSPARPDGRLIWGS